MAILNCRICGEGIEVELNNSDTTVDCEHCGHEVTIPCEIPSEHIADLFNEGNALRMAEEYDKAAEVYKRIIDESDPEWDGLAEAHWRLALCYHGVVYPKHPVTEEYVMMVRRDGGCFMTDDPDYLRAYELSDSWRYKEVAEKITELQKAGPDYAAPPAEKREGYYISKKIIAARGKDITDDFTDPTFRKIVLNEIGKGVSSIYEEGAATIEWIRIDNDNGADKIKNLAGIEHLTGLDFLTLRDCSALESIDISQNAKLTKFSCNNSAALTSVNLSNCTVLKEINCYSNKSLISINVAGCTALEEFICHGNALTTLDVSSCSKLLVLDCEDNKLTSLMLPQNKKMSVLACSCNRLTELDVSGVPYLETLGCRYNRMKSEKAIKGLASKDGTKLNYFPQSDTVDNPLQEWWDGLDKDYKNEFAIRSSSDHIPPRNRKGGRRQQAWRCKEKEAQLEMMYNREEISKKDYAIYLEKREKLGKDMAARLFLAWLAHDVAVGGCGGTRDHLIITSKLWEQLGDKTLHDVWIAIHGKPKWIKRHARLIEQLVPWIIFAIIIFISLYILNSR